MIKADICMISPHCIYFGTGKDGSVLPIVSITHRNFMIFLENRFEPGEVADNPANDIERVYGPYLEHIPTISLDIPKHKVKSQLNFRELMEYSGTMLN